MQLAVTFEISISSPTGVAGFPVALGSRVRLDASRCVAAGMGCRVLAYDVYRKPELENLKGPRCVPAHCDSKIL
jgi:hypothetical protein